MRRNRRGGRSGMEFGGSGEDSFVAVVVTKLTGALLFILLLTMVIMALLPKAIDLPSSPGSPAAEASKLAVTTPDDLPEAIAGRPYRLALAADGGRGHLRWTLVGDLPAGLTFDPDAGLIAGTPAKGTPAPVPLTIAVGDGSSRASRSARLLVYQSDAPLTTPSTWKPALPPVPWRDWFDQGFGFLIVWLVFLVGLSTIDALRRRSIEGVEDIDEARAVGRRFTAYRVALCAASLAASAFLGAWLWWPRG